MEPITTYCDNYEEITGKAIPFVETKVVVAPEQPAPAANVEAETKAPDDDAAAAPAPVETPSV